MPDEIVELTASLLDACAEVYVEAFAGPPWHDRWSLRTAHARLGDLLAMPGSVGYAWIDPGGIPRALAIGQLVAWEGGSVFRLAECCVHPAHQGRGIGRTLLNALEATAAKRGARSISLTTIRTVAPFYEASGYEIDADLVTLTRQLLDARRAPDEPPSR